MSVLNQSGEEQVECPLCMEPLEVDDLNFFPCTCGYQICRFCWHRIRTDENGLCPACRKAYSENPADFTPLSKEQVAQLKAEKRQRDQQRKAKLSESRKHLASVRVVQRNLVFVVGLPLRLADPEILKRHEYFGKFGRIHKVVINQSTAYAGSQGPSASAYVTYMKSDDALRAIQSVNNVTLDGRQIKSSLGTTKYCSHFMKNQPCPKPDCMYLHDFGDPEASFTKEQMHAGKHQEYEKKLHEALQSRLAAQSKQDQQQTASAQESNSARHQTVSKSKESPGSSASSTSSSSSSSSSGSTTNGNSNSNSNNNSKDTWPQLNSEKEKNEPATSGKKTEKEKDKSRRSNKTKSCTNTNGSSNCNNNNNNNITSDNCKRIEKQQQKTSILISSENQKISGDNSSNNSTSNSRMICREQNCIVVSEMSRRESESSSTEISAAGAPPLSSSSSSMLPKLPLLDDNSSFFSQNTFHKISPSEAHAHQQSATGDDELSADGGHGSAQVLNDSLPDINSCEDWEAAFGFTKHGNHLEELANTKDAFGSCYGTLGMDGPYIDGFSGGNGYDFKKDSLLVKLNKTGDQYGHQPQPNQSQPQHQGVRNTLDDRLTTTTTNGFRLMAGQTKDLNGGISSVNGGVDHMSKFFNDFYKNGQKDLLAVNGLATHTTSNGLDHIGGGLLDKHLMLLQQKQFEEQLMMLHLKPQQAQQQYLAGNGHYMNGDVLSQNGAQRYSNYQGQFSRSNSLPMTKQNSRPSAEDELDFDPFQETQKALAELIENEQTLKLHMSGTSSVPTSQINGLIHSQSGSNHLPPPPPGFVQPHMNSFGSKILPYLNMNSQQQQINTTQSNWPSNYNVIQQQHKGMGACNDWKVLDPAIVSSSSRYFSLANVRDHQYNPLQQQLGVQQGQNQQPQQPQQNGPIRNSYDFTSNTFSNLNHIQPSYNFSFSNNTSQQNLPWLGTDLSSQISSPPGFRSNSQATKQQEC